MSGLRSHNSDKQGLEVQGLGSLGRCEGLRGALLSFHGCTFGRYVCKYGIDI